MMTTTCKVYKDSARMCDKTCNQEETRRGVVVCVLTWNASSSGFVLRWITHLTRRGSVGGGRPISGHIAFKLSAGVTGFP